MKKYEQTVKEIGKLIDWYKRSGIDSKDRVILSTLRSKLACYNFNLAEIILETMNESATCKHLSKVNKAKKIVEGKNRGDSVAFSESLAIAGGEQLILNELMQESLYKGLNLLWDANNGVQNAIASHLKGLEDEEKKSKQQT